MKVIMTGGGTGGHIYPAIAIADKIMERTSDSEILFVGTERGLESRLVPKHGYEIKFITVSGINRKNLLKNIKVIKDYNKGRKQAEQIINDFQPDVVIGTGGYVSSPILKIASSIGIRSYIQEQNAVPGLTNKLLEKHVDNVFLGFEEAGRYFKEKEKHIVTGNPVRKEFLNVDINESRKKIGAGEDDFVLLVFGGSQGSGRINKAMLEVIKKYNGMDKMQVFFITGKTYYLPIIKDLEGMDIDIKDNIHILEYVDNMPDYLGACDLVVARSGALAVSEIAICGKPSILIPSPNVTGDHQTFNARAISDKGGAVLFEESKLIGESLFDEIDRLKQNPVIMKGMAEQTLRCASVDATDIIFYSILG